MVKKQIIELLNLLGFRQDVIYIQKNIRQLCIPYRLMQRKSLYIMIIAVLRLIVLTLPILAKMKTLWYQNVLTVFCLKVTKLIIQSWSLIGNVLTPQRPQGAITPLTSLTSELAKLEYLIYIQCFRKAIHLEILSFGATKAGRKLGGDFQARRSGKSDEESRKSGFEGTFYPF